MTHINCPNCDGERFIADELVWGDLTLFCDDCGKKIPVAEEGQIYADFGSGQ